MPDERLSLHIVITVHGIRTYGRWQERLQRLLVADKRWKHEDKKEVLIYRYGVFTLFSFVIPFLRNLAVKQFRDYLESIFEGRQLDRVDIVAHSFGAYLVIEALASPKLASRVRIHTAILCGSALPPNRNLSRLIGPERPIGRIINECGTRDGVLLLTLPLLGVGMAGRLGLQGFEGRTLRNRYHQLGHSGYFEQSDRRPYDGFMKRWWLPLLLGEEPARERDRRPDHPPFSDRLWRLLGENAGAFAISIYAGFLLLLAGTFALLWANAEAAKREAVANESRALTALSRVATENHRYADAVKLALAAWPRRRDDVRPGLETTLQTLSKAMSGDAGMTRQMRHTSAVPGALLTKDERRILSWSDHGSLMLWNAATGQQIGPAMKHKDSVRGALLTKDERRILSWSDDGSLMLWNAATGQQIGPAMKHERPVKGALLTKDERRILSWGGGSLMLWDAATGRQVGTAMEHEHPVNGALITKDERRILSWSEDGSLMFWDAASSRQIGPAMAHEGPVNGALMTDDERRILSWGGASLMLWDAATGQQIGPAMKYINSVRGALLTKDERRILSWGGGSLMLWDAATGQPTDRAMKHEGVHGALLTEDERRILSWSGDGSLMLWDAATGRQVGPVMKHDDNVFGALLTKDERHILSWSADGSLMLWDAATGRQIGPAMKKHKRLVFGALLTNDERRILSWSNDGTLMLWDAVTGQQFGSAMKHMGEVHGPLLTKDERRILSWSEDGSLMFWDAATGRQIGPTMKHEGSVRGALLTKDERRILSWGSGNFWDAATGQPIDPAVKHEGPDHGAPPTMDEWRNFSWSEDGSLMLWDASWPSGNLLEIACALLPDRDLTDISKRYGVQLIDPICGTLAAPVWSTIERAPAE